MSIPSRRAVVPATAALALITMAMSAASTARADGPSDVLNELAEAIGGTAILAGIADAVFESSVVLHGGQGDQRGDAITHIRYPDKISVTLTTAVAGEITQGFDGRHAWLKAGPQVVDLPPTMADEMARLIFVSAGIGLLVEAVQGRATLEGTDTGDASAALIWRRGASRLTLTVEEGGHLLTRAAYRSFSPQGTADVVVTWSDYRDAGGLRLPYRTTVYRNQILYSESLLKTARFNTDVPESVFAKP